MSRADQPDVPVSEADFAVAAPVRVAGEAAEAEGKEDKGRSLSLQDYPATYLLMGINILVFVVMVATSGLWRQLLGPHVLTAEFDLNTLVGFGGSDAYLVVHGQWWRLLTAAFVHVSLLHVALNMWCLWNLGVFGEPLLGRRGLVAVYMLTGITGNMFSLGWAAASGVDALVAGASGAVFGIAGILIVLLSNRGLRLPWEELKALRRQVIFFAVANLAIGLAPQAMPMLTATSLSRLHVDPNNLPRIDNTAHIGGFVCGLLLGLPLFPRMMSGKEAYRKRQRVTYVAATLVLCLVGYAIQAFAG